MENFLKAIFCGKQMIKNLKMLKLVAQMRFYKIALFAIFAHDLWLSHMRMINSGFFTR